VVKGRLVGFARDRADGGHTAYVVRTAHGAHFNAPGRAQQPSSAREKYWLPAGWGSFGMKVIGVEAWRAGEVEMHRRPD
jgi:hypothetical protein